MRRQPAVTNRADYTSHRTHHTAAVILLELLGIPHDSGSAGQSVLRVRVRGGVAATENRLAAAQV